VEASCGFNDQKLAQVEVRYGRVQAPAASTMTRADSLVWNPSHMVMNSVFIEVFASCSWFLRAPRMWRRTLN